MDGPITGSKSRFLHRIQNDKLQLQLDAFKFHQETRPEMYITCNLQAYPVMDAVNPFHKACSFIDGSWKAADGGDWACYSCQGTKDYAPSFHSSLQQSGSPPAPRQDQTSYYQKPNNFQPRIQEGSGSYFRSLLPASEPIPSWRKLILLQEEDEGISSVGWEQEKTVGPLAIFPKKSKMGFLAPPRVKEGVPPLPSLSKDKKPMPHSSLWKNGVTAEMDQVGGVTPPPSLEPTEHPNLMESEPESKKLEEEEEDDEYDSEDKEDYDGGDEDHDYEEKKGEAKESDQGMWKTRVLPEDFKERFTTHASKNEEDSGLRTLGTSPSLKDEEPADIYHPPKDS